MCAIGFVSVRRNLFLKELLQVRGCFCCLSSVVSEGFVSYRSTFVELCDICVSCLTGGSWSASGFAPKVLSSVD